MLGRRRLLRTAAAGTTAWFLPGGTVTARSGDRYPDAEAVRIEDPDVHYIEPAPDDGFHHPYLLYAPGGTDPRRAERTADGRRTTAGEQPLVVEQNARTTRDVEAVIESALDGIQYGLPRRIASELHSPALYSLLPVETADPSFQNLNRAALRTDDPPYERHDLQLLSMIDDARRRLAAEPYAVPPAIHLNGFSSSGLFADQFTALHPERVNAVSTGGNGVSVVPRAELDPDLPTVGEPEADRLPWQVGVADLESLVGTTFDLEAWLEVAQYRYIGGADQWDPDVHDHPSEYVHARTYRELDAERRQLLLDVFGWAQVDERFETSRRIHEHVGSPAEFVVYDGVGHTIGDEMMADVVAFHRAEMEQTYGPPAALGTGTDAAADPGTAPGDRPEPTAGASPDALPDGTLPEFTRTETLVGVGGIVSAAAALGASRLLGRREE